VDSMQALIIAIKMIGADLYSSSYDRSGKLMFGVTGSGYGFPVVTTMRDLLQGARVNVGPPHAFSEAFPST